MNKKIRTAVAGAAIAIASIGGVAFSTGGAFAASPNQATPGTPGTANCVGQTMAYLAQGHESLPGVTGIGNVASTHGLSVQEVKALVEAFCA